MNEEELDILKKFKGEGQEVVSKEEILRVIEAKEKELLEEISYLEKKEASLVGGVYDLSLFDENIPCENSDIILRKAIDSDKEPYYQLKKEYAYMKFAFAKPEYKDELWQEYLSVESLYYTIEKKKDNIFIGYCGIKNC